jgi:hypothetical protein
MKSTQWLINELNNNPAFHSQFFKEEFSKALEMENNTNNLLNNAPLFYPSAREWMWNYCIYLGPFTDSEKQNWDLGIFLDTDNFKSAAIVYGDTPGNYLSGDNINKDMECYQEMWRRARELKLIP